jgi:hypothetical protein
MDTFFASILSVLLTILGISFTIRYSSKYHIRKDKKYRERYEILEKIAHGTKSGFIDSARIVLAKSSIDKAIGFMDVSLTTHPEEIHVDRYSFIHSCSHVLFAPGKTILTKEKSWSERAPSNQFEDFVIKSEKLDSIPLDLIPSKLKSSLSECRAVESSFDYPPTYTGPRYKKRLLILAKGVGIVFCRTEYVNGDIDTYRLRNFKIKNGKEFWLPVNNLGNYWVYDIECQFGPNMLNMCE